MSISISINRACIVYVSGCGSIDQSNWVRWVLAHTHVAVSPPLMSIIIIARMIRVVLTISMVVIVIVIVILIVIIIVNIIITLCCLTDMLKRTTKISLLFKHIQKKNQKKEKETNYQNK